MAVFATFLQTFLQSVTKSFSSTKNSFSNVFYSEWFPIANAVLVGLALLVMYYLYRQAKKEQLNQKQQTKSDEDQPVTDLAWINQLISWLYVSSNQSNPVLIEAWLQDLNIALAHQQKRNGILIYGLRDGINPPLVKTIKGTKMDKGSVEAEVLLQTSDFGFYITVQENQNGKIIASSNYSAIVAQFQCWFSASLSFRKGNYVTQLVPTEKKPIFSFVMKPLTKQTLVTTAPEVVAESLKAAVLQTAFKANITTWCPYRETETRDDELDDMEERSCFGDSENDLDKEPEPARRSNSDGLLLETKKEYISNSVPVSRPSTPRSSNNKLRDLGDPKKALSGSVGSLNSITRTPSGRGPAKPIRLREKRLMVKISKIDLNSVSGAELLCHFKLNLPRQSRESTQAKSQETPVTFDLGSRSSQIDVRVTSGDSEVGKGVIFIDTIDLERPSQTSLALKLRDENVGSIGLEFTVIENYSSSSNSLRRNSIATLDASPTAQELFSTPQVKKSAVSGSGNAKPDKAQLTTVTARTVKRSPVRSPSGAGAVTAPVVDAEKQTANDQQVTFSAKSVAEAALHDLSSREKGVGVKKSKIVITSVEQENPVLVPNGDAETSSSASSSENPPPEEVPRISGDDGIVITASDSSPDKEQGRRNSDAALPLKSSSEARIPDTASLHNSSHHLHSDAKVRRSRSLIFGKKKKKEAKSSAAADDGHDTDDSLQATEPGLKKKSTSMSKLFGFGKAKNEKKKKDRPKSELEMVQENGSGTSPAKPKRATSFRRLVGKKEKSPKAAKSG